MRKILLLVSLCALPACAESIFSVGVIGGAPFTDVVDHTNQPGYLFSSKSTNYTIGPTIQINLPLNLRFEFDALYRPYGFAATSNVPAPQATGLAPSNVSARQWSFPLLAQYRFKFPLVSPFVEAGVAPNHISDISVIGANITSGAGRLIRQTNTGVVIGGGVDVKVPLVRISGELRYTHQSDRYFANISNLNQAEFLVGIRF